MSADDLRRERQLLLEMKRKLIDLANDHEARAVFIEGLIAKRARDDRLDAWREGVAIIRSRAKTLQNWAAEIHE